MTWDEALQATIEKECHPCVAHEECSWNVYDNNGGCTPFNQTFEKFFNTCHLWDGKTCKHAFLPCDKCQHVEGDTPDLVQEHELSMEPGNLINEIEYEPEYRYADDPIFDRPTDDFDESKLAEY